MAEISDAEEITTCPVCLEDYREFGDNVPRLLPCSPTLSVGGACQS